RGRCPIGEAFHGEKQDGNRSSETPRREKPLSYPSWGNFVGQASSLAPAQARTLVLRKNPQPGRILNAAACRPGARTYQPTASPTSLPTATEMATITAARVRFRPTRRGTDC